MIEFVLCIVVPVVVLNWIGLMLAFNCYHQNFLLPALAVRSHQEPPPAVAPLDFAPPGGGGSMTAAYGRAQLRADRAENDVWQRINKSY